MPRNLAFEITQSEFDDLRIPLRMHSLESLERGLSLQVFGESLIGLASAFQQVRLLNLIINVNVLVIRSLTASRNHADQHQCCQQRKKPLHGLNDNEAHPLLAILQVKPVTATLNPRQPK